MIEVQVRAPACRCAAYRSFCRRRRHTRLEADPQPAWPMLLQQAAGHCSTMAAPDADFQKAVDRVAQHLTSEDSKAVAASTVTLTLMLQSTPLPADLSAVVQRAAELLEAADVALQVGGS